jgi:hypothetical protein
MAKNAKSFDESRRGIYASSTGKPFAASGTEDTDQLRPRIERAFTALCLVFAVLWVFSIWRFPFGFLADYMIVFFLSSIICGYASAALGAKTASSVPSRAAATSFGFTILVWIFAPTGYPWSLFLSYIVTSFALLLLLSIAVSGNASDRWDRLSDRVGGFFHSIALVVVLFWLFGSNGLLQPINLVPSFFPDYILLIGFGIYILGSVIKSASFPLHHVALERASYSVAYGCLGSIILIILLRWFGYLSYSHLPDIERNLFLLFVGWLAVGIVLSTTKSMQLKVKEEEIKRTWWWERFSKPIRESAKRLSEELKGLKLSEAAYILPLGGQLVKTEKVSVESRPDTVVVPLTLEGNEVGAIYVGSGAYAIDASVKQFTSRFDGNMVVYTNPKTWEAMKSAQKLLQAYPEEIKKAGFENLEEIKKLAESRLSQFRAFGERVQGIEGAEAARPGRIHVPGVTVEEGPGYERVRLPFIDVISDENQEFVRVGPIKVWESSGKSVVKFGPYLALDESVPEAIAKPAKILITVWDRSGSEINLATLKDEIIFRNETIRLHVQGSEISFVDDGSSVRITRKLKEIRTPKLTLLVKPKIKAKLWSGAFRFKALASGTVFLKSRSGEVMKTKDEQLASRLIQQLDEMSDDLTRAVLEKRELEELAEFFSKMDDAFKEKGKNA